MSFILMNKHLTTSLTGASPQRFLINDGDYMTEHKENLGLSVPEINLWNGDCLELMKNIPDQSVDMVLTDPP